MDKEYRYLVATQCMTYNQASFIEDAINGFASQETSFPVVFLIVDDASIDGEQQVIKKWCKENLSDADCKSFWHQMPYGEFASSPLKGKPQVDFKILLLRDNYHQSGRHYEKISLISEWLDNAKYNAICEGDDYWINPQKLQIQVDFMESHPDYALCHTDFNLANGMRRNHTNVPVENDNYFPESIINGVRIGTATSLYRTDALQKCPHNFMVNKWPMGDYPLWIELSHEGKIKYFPIITACYRVVENSSSHGSLEKEIAFTNANLEIKRFYAEYYGVHLPNDGLTKSYYLRIMKCAHKHGSKEVARNCLNDAYRKKAVTLKTMVFFLATYSKIINRIVGLYWS